MNGNNNESSSPSCFSRIFCCCKPNTNTNGSVNKQNYEPKTNNNSTSLTNTNPNNHSYNNSDTNHTNNNDTNNNTGGTNKSNQPGAGAAGNGSGSGGIASLVTQVSQNSVPPSLPPQYNNNNNGHNHGTHLIHQSRTPAPQKFLLPPLPPNEPHKKCLVLDLDETLVHSSFKPIPDADFVMTIELENVMHRVYVRKRPGVDHFMKVVGEKFEVIIFTASLAKYADPLLDILDKHRVIKGRLFREACVQHYGNYVKDLTHLGRVLGHTMIIDNSPFSYMFQPENAIPISSWFHEKADRQLYELLPFLDELSVKEVDDVATVLQRKRFQFAQQ